MGRKYCFEIRLCLEDYSLRMKIDIFINTIPDRVIYFISNLIVCERIMDKSSIYFPVYRRIEKEVQELASAIFFCDEQMEVYSLDVADLIVRCVIEIESLAKDIYRLENKTEPETPGVCINWLDKKWKISKKMVVIISPCFHFEQMKFFFPFDYKDKSKEDYYSIYNAIKHDRVKNINKATKPKQAKFLRILSKYWLKISK